MIKIFLTVRNRLAISKKCIKALKKHSKIDHEIYVYNNLTNYKQTEHFEYFTHLLKKGHITQLTFNTEESTYGSFSKASSFSQFGKCHELDYRNNCDFILILDNDMIVLPGWDKTLLKAWKDIKSRQMKDIKIITQHPGGIKHAAHNVDIAGFKSVSGKLGGSGFWAIQPDFFKDIGYIKLERLKGSNKRHDQLYWNLLEEKSKGKHYIISLKTDMAIHTGPVAGSICNRLERNKNVKNKLDTIKYEESEEKIESMDFDSFLIMIKKGVEGSLKW